MISAEELAALRKLTSADLAEADADTLVTANRCPARWDTRTSTWLAERADVYGAAAEWWEQRAVALEAASSGDQVTSKRVGDVSVGYGGKSAAGRAWAMARRMARRSCRPDASGARTVQLLGPDVRMPGERMPYGGTTYPAEVGGVDYIEPRPVVPGVDPLVNMRELGE